MANKTRIEFDGFEDVLSRLSKIGGDTKAITEKILKETNKIITSKANEAIQPHRATGETEKSLKRSSNVEWGGLTASIETGFNISKGGLASIFIMYGTPKMKKDQKLYNAFYGKKTRDEIKQLQENMLYEEIRRLDG